MDPVSTMTVSSVPARLRKGQGAKEIGHNLARERPKFGHNSVRKRHKIFLRVNDQNLVLWAIDENMGTNLQAFYKHFYIGCLKTQKQQLHLEKIIFFFNFFFFNSGRACVNRAGRKPVRAGRGALRNRPSWNTVSCS